jgi:uncharacterized delta-60 repeat protein
MATSKHCRSNHEDLGKGRKGLHATAFELFYRYGTPGAKSTTMLFLGPTLFKLRALVRLVPFLAGAFLAPFAAGSPQPLTRAGAGHVDAQRLGPNGGRFAPYVVHQAWVARYNGSGHVDDVAHAIAIDNSGNLYVTGDSVGLDTGSDYVTIKYGPTGQVQWAACYNGPGNGLDEAEAIVIDGSGNVYVTGFSIGSTGFFGYATIKYNPAGQQQWIARYHGTGNGDDFALAIVVDWSGNVYVTGQSFALDGSSDYATIKYNAAGREEWVARYSRSGADLNGATAVAVDSSGNVYVTGESSFDYATIKYNAAGQEQWVARYNGPGNDADGATAIGVDDSGDVYVTGFSIGLGGNYDYATIKYSSAGQEQWVARYNGPGEDWDLANDMIVDASGNVYVTGQSVGTTYPDYDYATIKYDSDGDEQWVTRYNGPTDGEDEATAIALDNSGNVYVTGASVGSGGAYDYATVKYDSAGEEQWIIRYDGPASSYDLARAIAVDAVGHVYVTGNSFGSGMDSDYATIKYVQDAAPTPRPHPTPRPRPRPPLHPGQD